ncbi:putative bifunctional diguanylate cyclase/phosphodiesterase [Acuticoccus sediminis]|nr:bifunctional diguanylate cyclase/phosphodiesterase [Acuticoccus sediminis]
MLNRPDFGDDDPFEELASSACNLLADSLGVRYCGVVNADDASLRASSSEFWYLPEDVKRRIVNALSDAVLTAEYDAYVTLSSQLITLEEPDLGGTIGALFFPETEVTVFHLAPAGREIDTTRFRRAAVSALPILYRLEDLRAERHKLLQSANLLHHVEELAKVGGWEQTLASGRMLWSDEVYRMHGLEKDGSITLDRMLALYPSPARERLTMELERAAAERSGFDVTMPIRTASGDQRIVRTVGRAEMGPNGPILYGITQDVTSQMSAERRQWWAANHDTVTKLPNRLLFEDRIETAVQRARRDDRTFALLIIELANRNHTTTMSGFTLPDKLMLDVSARLSGVTRGSDTIARLSLNEFALILSDVKDRESLKPALSRLQAQVSAMRREDPGIDVVANVGVAFYPEHATGAEELTRAAEMALAQSRRTPNDPVRIFDHQIANDIAKRRQTILARARESLKKGEFVPYYQPQIDIETNQIVGAEALVRWQTADVLLDAKDFAYVLDDHEVGGEVGHAVLDGVIADIGKLRAMTQRPFRISVNASRTEVLRNDFLDTFLEKARNENLQPNDFIIEITEDVIIGVDDQTLHDKISYLASSGVEFSLDDFGTGYASLIHITSFPIKEIKIDKQFVFGIETDRRKRAIVKGIIQIARSMGLHVIAEGVETVEQQEALREIGCRYVQGYLYSFPLPFKEFTAMLEGAQT